MIARTWLRSISVDLLWTHPIIIIIIILLVIVILIPYIYQCHSQKTDGLRHFSFFLMLRTQVTGAWPPPVAGGAISERQHCCGSIQLLDRWRGSGG